MKSMKGLSMNKMLGSIKRKTMGACQRAASFPPPRGLAKKQEIQAEQ